MKMWFLFQNFENEVDLIGVWSKSPTEKSIKQQIDNEDIDHNIDSLLEGFTVFVASGNSFWIEEMNL